MSILETTLNVYEFRVKNKDMINKHELRADISGRLETEVHVLEKDGIGSNTKNDLYFVVYVSSGGEQNGAYRDIIGTVRKVCSAREIEVDFSGRYAFPVKVGGEIKIQF